jgi:DNA (cytosine-5)-methyltransferase 1
MKRSFLTVTDQFCGAGGSSLGATAVPDLHVFLAMNHWKLAIETHNTNFPDTHHDLADISQADPRRYPTTDILITSPECTNHSVAKGAVRRRKQMHLWEKEVVDPAAERSRATMWDVPRFAEYHQYNIIVTENVVDARQWILWDAWIHAMDSLGYDYHIVYFNSMFAHLDPRRVQSLHDFAPQSRDRMYVVFWKKGNPRPDLDFRPVAYCPACEKEVGAVQAWKRTKAVQSLGGRWGRYGDQYVYACPTCAGIVQPYYFAALNAIDWSLPAERIGDRQRPLKPKTIQRIEEGMRRFAGQHLMIETLFAGERRARLLSDPMLTQSARQSHALAMPFVFDVAFPGGENRARAIADAGLTQTTAQTHALAMPAPFLTSYYGSGGNERAVDEAMGTLTANDRHGLVMPFLLGYANGDGPAKSAVDPLRAFHTENGQALVQPTEIPDVDDVHFRMLQPHEVGRGMAFPGSYVVLGTKRDQVKQLGNAVTPPVMRMILERCVATLQ